MALGLWCQIPGITRQNYQSLLEVFELLENLETLKNLPRSVTTLKKYVKAQLTLLKLRHQGVPITLDKQPTQGSKSKASSGQEEVFFFDYD